MYCLRLKKKVSGGEALKEHEFLGGEEQGFCLVIFFILFYLLAYNGNLCPREYDHPPFSSSFLICFVLFWAVDTNGHSRALPVIFVI